MGLAQGQRQLGLELLLESLALHEQTYGFLHPETARCYSTLAMIYYQADDKDTALDFQRKAVIVSERTAGVDSTDAVHNYVRISHIVLSLDIPSLTRCFSPVESRTF